jgi:hypothetical protein
VHVPVLAPRQPSDPSHVLGEDLAGRNASQEIQRQVAVAGEDDVVGVSGESGANGDGFLPPADVDAPYDLALAVELLLDAVLDLTR